MRASLRPLHVELDGAAGAQRSARRPRARTLTFDPALDASTDPDLFQCFWSNGTAWGVFRQRRDSQAPPEIEVLGGSLGGVVVSAAGKSWRLDAKEA